MIDIKTRKNISLDDHKAYLREQSLKREAIRRAKLAKGIPIDLYADCDSYEVAPALIGNYGVMPYADWLAQVGEHWSSTDNLSRYREELLNGLGDADDKERRLLMTDEENRAYDALPELLTVYRGCYEHNRYGLSWSLCKDVAAKFPLLTRYQHKKTRPLLLKIEGVPKKWGFLKLDRGELEFALLFELEYYMDMFPLIEIPLDFQELENKILSKHGGRSHD